MKNPLEVRIHPSQFPERIHEDLRGSLASRRVNHKFHYDSIKQARKWMALHRAYAPSATNSDCAAMYGEGFKQIARRLEAFRRIRVASFGCGGGQKDIELLRLLRKAGGDVSYAPSDVSLPLVATAALAAGDALPGVAVEAWLFDFLSAGDLPGLFCRSEPGTSEWVRLFCFFGLLPNFEPRAALAKLAALMQPGDLLALSANLSPGPDYEEGLRRVTPLYDNDLTADWLMTFLLDLGVERDEGELRFRLERCPEGTNTQRITAFFHFAKTVEVLLGEDRFEFGAGEELRLFFSYRHEAGLLEELLREQGLRLVESWIARSGEEGLFLCARD